MRGKDAREKLMVVVEASRLSMTRTENKMQLKKARLFSAQDEGNSLYWDFIWSLLNALRIPLKSKGKVNLVLLGGRRCFYV